MFNFILVRLTIIESKYMTSGYGQHKAALCDVYPLSSYSNIIIGVEIQDPISFGVCYRSRSYFIENLNNMPRHLLVI